MRDAARRLTHHKVRSHRLTKYSYANCPCPVVRKHIMFLVAFRLLEHNNLFKRRRRLPMDNLCPLRLSAYMTLHISPSDWKYGPAVSRCMLLKSFTSPGSKRRSWRFHSRTSPRHPFHQGQCQPSHHRWFPKFTPSSQPLKQFPSHVHPFGAPLWLIPFLSAKAVLSCSDISRQHRQSCPRSWQFCQVSLKWHPSFNTRYMNSHRTPFDAELVSSSFVCGHLADEVRFRSVVTAFRRAVLVNLAIHKVPQLLVFEVSRRSQR